MHIQVNYCKLLVETIIHPSRNTIYIFKMIENLAILSSLRTYRDLGQGCTRGPAAYLHDRLNRKGTRLLTFARLGQLTLLDRLSKMAGWPPAGSYCMLCNTNRCEDIEHFLTMCPLLKPCRDRLIRELAAALDSMGAMGACILDKCKRGATELLQVILGRNHPELTDMAESARMNQDHHIQLLYVAVYAG